MRRNEENTPVKKTDVKILNRIKSVSVQNVQTHTHAQYTVEWHTCSVYKYLQ